MRFWERFKDNNREKRDKQITDTLRLLREVRQEQLTHAVHLSMISIDLGKIKKAINIDDKDDMKPEEFLRRLEKETNIHFPEELRMRKS